MPPRKIISKKHGKEAAVAERLERSSLTLKVLDLRRIIQEPSQFTQQVMATWLRVGEGEDIEEEEWHLTSLTLSPIQVDFIATTLSHGHWVRDSLPGRIRDE